MTSEYVDAIICENKIEAHPVISTKHKTAAEAARERNGCRSGYRGGYQAGITENILNAVALMRGELSLTEREYRVLMG